MAFDLEKLLSSAPVIGAKPKAAAKRSPLGVPDGEFNLAHRVAEGLGGASNQRGAPLPPRYYDGDQFRPASMSPEQIAELQRGLASAGLYGSTTRFRLGVWDEVSANAYKGLLEYANRTGLDESRALQAYAMGVSVDPDDPNSPAGSGGSTRAPLTIRQSNPADVQEMIDVVVRAKTGRRDDATVQRLTQALLADERRAQVADYNAAETGGVVTETPSVETFASRHIEAQNPTLTAARDEFNIVSQVMQGLGQISTGEEYGL